MAAASNLSPSRRAVVKSGAAAAVIATAWASRSSAQGSGKATFVLVHPAWLGGWCWRKAAMLLRAHGHDVFEPTLTGLGERAHLSSPEISLATHIEDVVNVLEFEGLRRVILVGNSSAGMVITGVLDRVPERIGHLVYLDAFVPEDGESLVDLLPADRRQVMEELVNAEGQGWLLPRFAPLPPEKIVRDIWGVTSDDDVSWMLARLSRRRSGISRILSSVRTRLLLTWPAPSSGACSFNSASTRPSIVTQGWPKRLRVGVIGSWRRLTCPMSRIRQKWLKCCSISQRETVRKWTAAGGTPSPATTAMRLGPGKFDGRQDRRRSLGEALWSPLAHPSPTLNAAWDNWTLHQAMTDPCLSFLRCPSTSRSSPILHRAACRNRKQDFDSYSETE
jgi:pimeloyl-ACP methyl ester carboxylesterase